MIDRAGSLKISVVMGTYNGERFIREQLESLFAQTLPPHEIIVADDGSTDGTVAIVRALARRSPVPLHLSVNPRNLGYGDNFLQAAYQATGDLIAFCDQDDVWYPDKLAVCAGEFEPGRTTLVVHTARLIDAEGTALGRFDQAIRGMRTSPPLHHNPWWTFFGFTMLFRSELLTRIPAWERGTDYVTGTSMLSHDRWIMFLANMLGEVREIDRPLADYRQHGRNVFGVNTRLAS